jgi:hypothetical protein
MPEVTVQPSTYERLEKHAKAFVDTPETVILRALDALEAAKGEDAPVNGRGPEPERRIDPRALPNLTHTKVLDASIDGKAIAKPNWNLLLEEMVRRAMKRAGSLEKVRQLCPVNMMKGRKEDEGYSYLPDIDVSVQGQDANGACRAIVTAAQGLGVALEIGFMWRLKEAAAHPGEHARIVVANSRARERL